MRCKNLSAIGLFLVGSVCIGMLAPSQTSAEFVFGNFDGSILNGYNVGPGGGLNNAIAEGFIAPQTLVLTGVDLYLRYYTPAAGSGIQLSIYDDVGGHPGTAVYNLVPTTALPTSSTPTLVRFEGVALLSGGTKYWLDLYATNPSSTTGSSIEWAGSSTSPSGAGFVDLGQLRSVSAGNPPTGTPTFSELRTAFEIHADLQAVPEPGSTLLALSAFAAVGLGAKLRGRRTLRRVHCQEVPIDCSE